MCTTDKDMLELARQDRPVSKEDLGIDTSNTMTGMIEGLDFEMFGDHSGDTYKGSED